MFSCVWRLCLEVVFGFGLAWGRFDFAKVLQSLGRLERVVGERPFPSKSKILVGNFSCSSSLQINLRIFIPFSQSLCSVHRYFLLVKEVRCCRKIFIFFIYFFLFFFFFLFVYSIFFFFNKHFLCQKTTLSSFFPPSNTKPKHTIFL